MGRKPLKATRPRTLNLDIDTYDAILSFWRRSNTGIAGAVVIRELLKTSGKICQQRIAAENYSFAEDVFDLNDFISRFISQEKDVTR
jgi:hypothetical protein